VIRAICSGPSVEEENPFMSDSKRQNQKDQGEVNESAAESTADPAAEGEAPETAAGYPGPDAGEPSDAPESEPSEADQIARLEVAAAELRDQLLRALAEQENQRRRSRREREEAVRYAAAPLLRDLLNVVDNLSRALASVPDGAAENDEPLKTLLDGVKLTERELQSVFERHNIVRLDPLGERLNPHQHEAMFEMPDPSVPAGTVVQVLQSGYLLHDRLLRPARVGVAKGGPAATAPPPATGGETSDETGAEESPAAPKDDSSEPGGRADPSA
jgi:molecular chaperone GrpE